eukprot:311668_1
MLLFGFIFKLTLITIHIYHNTHNIIYTRFKLCFRNNTFFFHSGFPTNEFEWVTHNQSSSSSPPSHSLNCLPTTHNPANLAFLSNLNSTARNPASINSPNNIVPYLSSSTLLTVNP